MPAQAPTCADRFLFIARVAFPLPTELTERMQGNASGLATEATRGPRAALAPLQRRGDRGDRDTRPSRLSPRGRGDTVLSLGGSACWGWRLLDNNSNAVILLSMRTPLRASASRMKTPR